MTDNMKKFLELVSGNETLAARLNGASKDEIIALAKEAGFTLAEADFKAPQNVEISDDELDVVTGGRSSNTDFPPTTVDCKTCVCYVSGLGHGTAGSCRCVVQGTGDLPTIDLEE